MTNRTDQDRLFGLVLLAALAVTYSPLWNAGIIWDDAQHITRPELRSWHGLELIWFQLGATQQYYPLVHSVFWLEHRMWGDEPFGYHVVNILLSGLSAFLLLKILRLLEIPGAWLATALFALHPVQVETIAWITEIKNILSGLFYFGAAMAYLKFDRSRKTGFYFLAIFLFVAGLLSKTVVASLPAALLVIFWWKRGRISWKQDLLPLAPFFIVGIFLGLFTAWVEQHFIGAEGAKYNFTFVERCLIAGHALWFYFGKLMWPANLIFIYPRWDISQAIWWQYLYPASAMGLFALLIWLSRRARGPLGGVLFFAGTLFPAIGFFNVYPFRYSFVADHFQYIASLGIIVPCVAGLVKISRVMAMKSEVQAFLGTMLVMICAILSWQQTWAYQDEETLWRTTLVRNSGSQMVHYNLGNLLLRRGDIDESIPEFEKALTLDSTLPDTFTNLGSAFLCKGQLNDAIAQFRDALKLDPANSLARDNLDFTLARQKKVNDATEKYRARLKLNPRDVDALSEMGLIYNQDGQNDMAMADFAQAIEINPQDVKALHGLGVTYSKKGQVDSAIELFKKVLAIEPDDADIHNDLGVALIQKNQVNEAIVQFQAALKAKPDSKSARDNLASAQTLLAQRAGKD